MAAMILFLFLLLSGSGGVLGVGINYGQIADNLPSPERVVGLLQSIKITKAKLYDADPKVLRAFANSGIEFAVGLSNQYVNNMADPANAVEWVKNNVLPYLPATKITTIAVGNEVYTSNDTLLMQNLVPAMQNVYAALVAQGLQNSINVSTAHSSVILATSYPPSAGTFKPELTAFLKPLLDFLAQNGSPFLINAYPFFAYIVAPDQIPLDYVLFQPNEGQVDPGSNLKYTNMLHAQVDSVYAALTVLGYQNIEVQVSETGWPSKGDPDEVGATPENAKLYNGNLLSLLAQNNGTPMRPSVRLDTYVFALFNENLKKGKTSERNYGLYNPDGTPVYDLGLGGSLSDSNTISHSISPAQGMHYHTFFLSIYLQVLFASLCSFFVAKFFLH